RLGDAPAVGTGLAGADIDPGLVRDAVLPGICAFVDVTALLEQGEQPLHSLLVARLGGADEVGGAEAEVVPERPELRRDLVDELLWRAVRRLGGALDLLPVLVGAGEEEDVEA